jgi:hypothetical protein
MLFVFWLFTSLVLSGCGAKKSKTDKTPLQNYEKMLFKGEGRMDRLFPEITSGTLTARDNYIRMQTHLTLYMMRGGNPERWLKLNQIPVEDWKFMHSYYWMDPTNRKEVKDKTDELLKSHPWLLTDPKVKNID